MFNDLKIKNSTRQRFVAVYPILIVNCIARKSAHVLCVIIVGRRNR